MSKLMLVTTAPYDTASGGRQMLSEVHRTSLEQLFGKDLLVHRLDREHRASWRSTAPPIRGYIDGLTRPVVTEILGILGEADVHRIYLDGSNLGMLARAVKKQRPQTEVLTFFHNVEARFFLGSLRSRRSARAVGVLVANYLAERSAVRHSDRLITLSERDSRLLARVYGRLATDILPIALHDKLTSPANAARGSKGGNYILFVGGAFYANEGGIAWFVENVVPHIPMKTCIVGRGMERLRSRLERNGKVEVIGAVDDLSEWYLNAKAVIAPIFDGSGMKTKVAEALMFGKRVVGTKEAFSGYEEVAAEAGWICETKDQFVTALRAADAMDLPLFDAKLRSLYDSRYSAAAALGQLAALFAEQPRICQGVRGAA